MNIIEILKNKPKGTKLYTPMFGECIFDGLENYNIINIRETDKHREIKSFFSDGTYAMGGECLLFPSKEMRDWQKFSWKKGDALLSNDKTTEVMFNGWYDDSYTSFYAKHYLDETDKSNIKYLEGLICTTDRYVTEAKVTAQRYINTIEERLGGKLNMETLEVEKQEFKAGDILFVKYEDTGFVFILSVIHNGLYNSKIRFELGVNELTIDYRDSHFQKERVMLVRYATDEEKQKLFSALEKEDKKWNADTKQIEDIKPKWTPKPFDKVLTRIQGEVWRANIFSHIDSDGVKNCIDDRYIMCIPYNEQTAHLIGTNESWEG